MFFTNKKLLADIIYKFILRVLLLNKIKKYFKIVIVKSYCETEFGGRDELIL